MRLLLITPRLEQSRSYTELREALDVRWSRILEAAGLVPVVVPTEASAAPYFELPGVCGLLLSGGGNISAVCDDKLAHMRDAREGELVDVALHRNLPVLGVCRGAQFLGTRYGLGLAPISDHVGSTHRITVGSTTQRFRAHEGAVVNSFHALGLEGQSPFLTIAARSEDGAVEAFEHSNFAVTGMMWHPERYDTPQSADVALLAEVFGALQTRSGEII